MPKQFLTAEWRNLILANYSVPERMLQPWLPRGVEPDRWQDQCWVSLVGFQFLQTKVFGIGWPGYRNFTEWNLRAYVRHGEHRGVVFVREYVRSRLISRIARWTYNEPYYSVPITEQIHEKPDHVHATYRVQRQGIWHAMQATSNGPAAIPAENSPERWFINQSRGFGRTRRGDRTDYRVDHPQWRVYPIASYSVDVDWEKLYGPEWAEMNGQQPENMVFVEGSEVSVYPANIEKS